MNGKAEKPGESGSTEAASSVHESDAEFRMADPPDGGWGWVVVFSSFMIHVIADGVTYTFGIFYMEFLKYFQESKGATSWVASIMVGTTFCIGPIASGLTNKFGCRTVTIIGSLLATFGLIMSTVAPSINYLYFSAGLCTGSGFGLMYLPAIVCVTCYFEKKRAFATGIAVCGSGIGTFALAPLTEWMVAELGWQGAMLIIAGLVLNCCVFGALFRPLEKVKIETPIQKSFPLEFTENGVANCYRKGSLPNGTLSRCETENKFSALNQDTVYSRSLLAINQHQNHSTPRNSIENTRLTRSITLNADGTIQTARSRASIGSIGPLDRKDIFYSGSLYNLDEYKSNPEAYSAAVTCLSIERKQVNIVKSRSQAVCDCLCPEEMQDAFVQMMDFRLMRNVIFLMFGFSNFFTNIGFNVPFVYTKDRAVGMNVADEKYASYLLSIIGIANTIGRVILGYLSDRKWVNRLWLYNGSLTICGFATIFSSYCNTYMLMGLYAIAFGATAGAYVSLTSVILVDLLGLEKLTNAFGLLLLFEGVACLIGPPITGWLHDFTGSYDPGFSVSGSMIALSGLMLFFIPCVQRYLSKQKELELAPDICLEVSLSSPAKV